jgi:GNAT superfamily N-acetyltransferase
MKEDIEIRNKFGYAIGFVAPPNDLVFREYLNANLGRVGVLSECKKYSEIGVLCDLFVEEAHQGNGQGKELLKDFVLHAKRKGANIIILLLDTAEKQRYDFNLAQFYKNQGFEFMENQNWMIKYR